MKNGRILDFGDINERFQAEMEANEKVRDTDFGSIIRIGKKLLLKDEKKKLELMKRKMRQYE